LFPVVFENEASTPLSISPAQEIVELPQKDGENTIFCLKYCGSCFYGLDWKGFPQGGQDLIRAIPAIHGNSDRPRLTQEKIFYPKRAEDVGEPLRMKSKRT
jgi:hypothetical protein